MVVPVVSTKERETASRRIIALGFVYPDAIDLRTALPRGYSHVPVLGSDPQTSGAQPRLTPDPGLANEQTAAHPQPQSAEGERSSDGGAS